MQDDTLDAETLGLLEESLQRYGRERYGFETRKGYMRAPDAFGREAWDDYAAMGWLAIPLPADDGGFGSAPEAIGTLMHYVGSSLALEPVFASVVLCGRILGLAGDVAGARECLQALGQGTIFALAHAENADDGMLGEPQARCVSGLLSGSKSIVLHGDTAERLLVTARDDDQALGIYLVEAGQPAVRRSAFRLVDGRGAANIQFDVAKATPLAVGPNARQILERALDDARLALCSEGLGVGAAVNAMTLAYLKERRQFGRPIGANQALQHRMVELHMLQEESRCVISAAHRATPSQRPKSVLAALAHVVAFTRQATHEAVQMHGGIGITEELAVSHYFRRAMVIQRLLGDRAFLLQQFAQAAASAS